MVNIALHGIGRKERVGSLYDGSEAATIALDAYAQTRDALLRKADWGFPRRDAVLTLLKSAPAGGYGPAQVWNPATNPPQPYGYEYAYPTDCLMLRSLIRPLMFIPYFTPQPVVWEIANDQVPVAGQDTPPGRVILAQIANAIATYCGQVTDMTTWDVGFVESLIEGMKLRLAPAMAELDQGKVEASKTELQVAPAVAGQAAMRVG